MTNTTLLKPAFFSEHFEQLFECVSRARNILEGVAARQETPWPDGHIHCAAQESCSYHVREAPPPDNFLSFCQGTLPAMMSSGPTGSLSGFAKIRKLEKFPQTHELEPSCRKIAFNSSRRPAAVRLAVAMTSEVEIILRVAIPALAETGSAL